MSSYNLSCKTIPPKTELFASDIMVIIWKHSFMIIFLETISCIFRFSKRTINNYNGYSILVRTLYVTKLFLYN